MDKISILKGSEMPKLQERIDQNNLEKKFGGLKNDIETDQFW